MTDSQKLDRIIQMLSELLGERNAMADAIRDMAEERADPLLLHGYTDKFAGRFYPPYTRAEAEAIHNAEDECDP